MKVRLYRAATNNDTCMRDMDYYYLKRESCLVLNAVPKIHPWSHKNAQNTKHLYNRSHDRCEKSITESIKENLLKWFGQLCRKGNT